MGYYGNPGGTACDGTTGTLTTDQLISQSLTNWGGTLTVGRNTRTVVMTNTAADRLCIMNQLPGGGPAKELSVANYGICSLPAAYLQNGRIKNVLLGQTITLGLNLGITSPSDLGDFVLQGGVLATAEPLGGCGSDIPTPRSCYIDPNPPYHVIVVNEYKYFTIDAAVVAAIVGPKTVRGLFELANDALANTDGQNNKENGVSIGAIASAVDAINKAFDKCRIFVGWDVPACVPPAPPTSLVNNGNSNPGSQALATEDVAKINVTTYPNPYTDKVRFVISSKVSGQGVLEVYNLMGTKLQVVYTGYIFAGNGQTIEYRVPELYRTNLVYVLRVGDNIITGKLANTK
jgi:hypothetical protein